MKDIIYKENFFIHIDKNTVFQMLRIDKDSSLYEEMTEEYEQLKETVLNNIKPKVVLAFSEIKSNFSQGILDILPVSSQVLYSIMTIGEDISRLYQRYYDDGQYVKSLLIDAMADVSLFALEEEVKTYIKEVCKERGYGVACRYDPPVNIPLEMQKIAFYETKAREYLSLHITKGLMLDPVKSCCQIYALTKEDVFQLNHDCNICNARNCNLRQSHQITVKVVCNQRDEVEVTFTKEVSILNALLGIGIPLSAVCGGNGLCGKCKIQVLEGELPITKADETYFTSKELEKGYRLACKALPKNHCKIALEIEEKDYEILTEYVADTNNVNTKDILKMQSIDESSSYCIAVDIGTTTIAISMVSKKGTVLDTYTVINHQKIYGSDVISRIRASVEGRKVQLKESIKKDLLEGFITLSKRNEISLDRIKDIVIAANTTMVHLLLGYEMEGMAAYPFTPVNIQPITCDFREIFQTDTVNNVSIDCKISILPGISAFIGGDIVSGLYLNHFYDSSNINLLLDIGTNGEMVLGNNERLLATSTAAGPAFEGGNITWGIGSVQGAICSVTILNGKVVYKTIGDIEPVGICGTGVIEIMYELLQNGLVDKNGLLSEEYRSSGFILGKTKTGTDIVFTQKDIRELQLAKAAIRAGIEILILRYGITYEQVNKVYLAGGFGYKMNQEKAIGIGLIPQELSNKIEVVGNSSLGGAIKFCKEKDEGALKELCNVSKELNLPMDEKFNELYVEYMNF